MLSGYRQWNELSHANDWFVFSRNIGRRICADEMVISEYIIIVSTPEARGVNGILFTDTFIEKYL